MFRTEPDQAANWVAQDVPVRTLAHRSDSAAERLLRRAIDVTLSSMAILLFSWVYLVVWCGVRLTTGGPVIYSHGRVGKGGREFGCLKFRSMVIDADRRLEELLRTDPEARAEWDATFKLKNDPRVTRFGAFIRRTSLDELPQLFNVLRGDMSLVGPRPVTRRELDLYYGQVVSLYASVKPGITGLWQVSGRSALTYDQRVGFDMNYIQTRTLGQDLKILLRTVAVVLGGRGSH